MEPMALITLVIFLVTIGLIIWGKWDRTVVGFVGVVLMVALGTMTEVEAFHFVDWNIIAILFSIWVIASYFAQTGVPQFLAITMLKLSRNNIGLFLTLFGTKGYLCLPAVRQGECEVAGRLPKLPRVVQREGQKANPRSFLLWHAIGANTGGQIGSVMAAAVMLAIMAGMGIAPAP